MTGDPSYRNPNKYCDYHKQNGHKVEFCQSFKAHIERLVKDGHLKQYLPRGENVNSARTAERREERPQARRDEQPRRRENARRTDEEPERFISVIHLAPATRGSGQARDEARRAAHGKHVMAAELEPPSKKARRNRPPIFFSEEDLEGVHLPHNDPLLVTLKLGSCRVQRILVDPGSSSEILYFDCFKRMGLAEEDLQEARIPLIGFSAKPVYPKGKITIKVQVEGASLFADFLVVDAPSPYNAIVGRTWLHNMEAVPSTYHQKLKFP